MPHLFISDKEPNPFSWTPCELCKSTLGGERHTVVEMNDNFEGEELEVCVDCCLKIAGE